MNYHSQLNLIMLATVIGLAVFLYLRPAVDSIQEYNVSAHTSDVVKSIRIVRSGIEIQLKKCDDNWFLEKPVFVAADKDKVNKVLEILSASSQQRFSRSEQSHLGQDQLLVELYIDDVYFGFGGLAPTTNLQYLVTDQHIDLVSPRYAVFLPSSPLELARTSLLAEDEIPVQFETNDWRVYQQDLVWHVQFKEPKEVSNSKELDDWHQLWRKVHASNLAVHDQIEIDLELSENSITIHLQDGRVIHFAFFKYDSELVLLRLGEAVSYHFPPEIGGRLLNPGAMSR